MGSCSRGGGFTIPGAGAACGAVATWPSPSPFAMPLEWGWTGSALAGSAGVPFGVAWVSPFVCAGAGWAAAALAAWFWARRWMYGSGMAGTTGFFTRGLPPGPLRRFAAPLAVAIIGGTRDVGGVGSRHGIGHEGGDGLSSWGTAEGGRLEPAARRSTGRLGSSWFCLCAPRTAGFSVCVFAGLRARRKRRRRRKKNNEKERTRVRWEPGKMRRDTKGRSPG